VNNKVIKEPWFLIKEDDIITVDGKVLKPPIEFKYEYYVLNKPKGYVTTLHDPKEQNTVKKLIEHVPTPLKPAGRLDKDTTGVLILTNDGELINILTSAKYGIKKVYIAKVSGIVRFEDLLKLKTGIYESGDFLKIESFEILKREDNYSIVKVELIKGKKHEIKRLFKYIGHEVLELKRIAHGPIDISLVPHEGDMKKIEGTLLQSLLELKQKP